MIYLPIHQLSDVAEGLNYLHCCNAIHGDLKGVRNCSRSLSFIVIPTPSQSNVLVDPTGRARITNSGILMATHNLSSIQGTSTEHKHSVRWVAPEILDGRGTCNREGDVFSFAMVVIEVRCG